MGAIRVRVISNTVACVNSDVLWLTHAEAVARKENNKLTKKKNQKVSRSGSLKLDHGS